MESSADLPSPDPGTRADNFVQREPARAVFSALGAGVVLSMLPLAPIVSALTCMALSLLRPALLLLGMAKAVEICRGCGAPSNTSPENDHRPPYYE